MPPTPLIVPRFGPLRVDADPQDLGFAGAVSLQNVEFDPSGTVRCRPGYDLTTSSTVANPVWLTRFRGASKYATIGTGGGGAVDLRIYDSALASTDTETIGNTPSHVCEFSGSPLGSGVGLYVVGTSNTLYLYDNSTLALLSILDSDATQLRGKFIALWPGQSRLAIGPRWSNVGASNGYRLQFSNAGDATVWTAGATGDFVDLDPEDGQNIRMLVGWGGNLYVFKDRKFYRFYGVSTDTTGGAVFNYETVDTGVGCGYDYAACAAQDGVYFVHQDGVYRTTGGRPEMVSQALQPFFDARPNGFFSPTGPLSSPRIHAGDDRLYVWQKGATGVFVMDLRSREWTYWVLATAPSGLLPLDTPREFLFLNNTGQVHTFSPDYSDDDGAVIASHYQSGFQELASGRSARVRTFYLHGTGTLTHSLFSDLETSSSWQGTAAASVTMGVDPEVARAVALQSGRARSLSFRVSATSGSWALSRWQGNIMDARSA